MWFCVFFFLIPALLASCTRGPLRAGDQGAAAQGECGVLEKDRKEGGGGGRQKKNHPEWEGGEGKGSGAAMRL